MYLKYISHALLDVTWNDEYENICVRTEWDGVVVVMRLIASREVRKKKEKEKRKRKKIKLN